MHLGPTQPLANTHGAATAPAGAAANSSRSLSLSRIPPYMWAGAGVVALVALVAGLARAAEPSGRADSRTQVAVKTFIRSARQCCAHAGNSALGRAERLSHARSGLAYTSAAQTLLPSAQDIDAVCGVRFGELQSQLRRHEASNAAPVSTYTAT